MKFIAVTFLLFQLLVPSAAGYDEEVKLYSQNLSEFMKSPGYKAALLQCEEIENRVHDVHNHLRGHNVNIRCLCDRSERDKCVKKMPKKLRNKLSNFDQFLSKFKNDGKQAMHYYHFFCTNLFSLFHYAEID